MKDWCSTGAYLTLGPGRTLFTYTVTAREIIQHHVTRYVANGYRGLQAI